MKQTNKKETLLSFPVIVAASSGDVNAINEVMKHYENYIITLSTRTLYDEFGNPRICVDEEIRCRLQAKLLASIMNFRIE